MTILPVHHHSGHKVGQSEIKMAAKGLVLPHFSLSK
jgi:hypothetical protein